MERGNERSYPERGCDVFEVPSHRMARSTERRVGAAHLQGKGLASRFAAVDGRLSGLS